MQFQIDTKGNQNFKLAIIQVAMANGYKRSVPRQGSLTPEGAAKELSSWNILTFVTGHKTFSANGTIESIYGDEVKTFNDFVNLIMESKTKEVVLNNEYTAKVFEDGHVEVGCQNFTKEKVAELIGAVNSFKG